MKTKPLAVCAAVLVLVGGSFYLAYILPINARIARQAVQEGQYASRKDAENAISQDPNNALAHQRLGESLAGHNTARAIAEFRAVVRLDPSNREVQSELAYELARTGDIAEAKQLYGQLAAQDDQWGRSAKRHLRKLAAS